MCVPSLSHKSHPCVISGYLFVSARNKLKIAMNEELRIISWIKDDDLRTNSLQTAALLNLNDWCIGAGFVRNLVWDKLHGFEKATPLNDLDLIYFDTTDTSENRDLEIEKYLQDLTKLPWSVKNQARMHIRNNSAPYSSCRDAMSYWSEIETAVGAYIQENEVKLMCPFGVAKLTSGSITRNPKCIDQAAFNNRVTNKGWLGLWPKLGVSA